MESNAPTNMKGNVLLEKFLRLRPSNPRDVLVYPEFQDNWSIPPKEKNYQIIIHITNRFFIIHSLSKHIAYDKILKDQLGKVTN